VADNIFVRVDHAWEADFVVALNRRACINLSLLSNCIGPRITVLVTLSCSDIFREIHLFFFLNICYTIIFAHR